MVVSAMEKENWVKAVATAMGGVAVLHRLVREGLTGNGV